MPAKMNRGNFSHVVQEMSRHFRDEERKYKKKTALGSSKQTVRKQCSNSGRID
jgi:hypothetical protein